jgi:hypothetical protein
MAGLFTDVDNGLELVTPGGAVKITNEHGDKLDYKTGDTYTDSITGTPVTVQTPDCVPIN